ncbi:unnamed protein product [Dicrocoelium dendriticum]|nr:unnamed protein product [Dicrocoelium dendriticum]
MACSSALVFCVTHRENRDEAFLVGELSKVRMPLAKGFKYFTDAASPESQTKIGNLKEPVERFIVKLSTYLGLQANLCHEVFVQFLAAHENLDDSSIQRLFMNGRMRSLLNRVRVFYWQERLALCGLFRLALCYWHVAWAPISDVLFAMTTFKSRAELIDALLDDYQRATQNTELLLKSRSHFVDNTYFIPTLGVPDIEHEEDFNELLVLQLREQLELLHAIFVGVHAMPLSMDSGSSEFTRFLETFWSKSFGLHSSMLNSFGKHRTIMNRICFLQTLILIRTARLDAPSLFPDAHKVQARDSRHPNTRRQIGSSQTTNRLTGTPPTSTDSRVHFMSNHRLLNRFLVSLSNLGELPIHGPLLLFGAVCATSFGSDTRDLMSHTKDSVADDAAESPEEFSEAALLIAEQYGQLAVESLKVFTFLNTQLDELMDEPSSLLTDTTQKASEGEDWLINVRDQDLLGFCAHVVVFDLLALLTRDIVLWSLDSRSLNPSDQSYELFGLPNRTAFIRLFSKVLRVVAEHVHFASRSPCAEFAPSGAPTSDFGAGLGIRLARLIETLAESFPHDLSILRLCTALMIPNNQSAQKEQSNTHSEQSLVQLVSELVCSMPYLAQPLTSDLSARLNQITPWYPQLDTGGDFVPTDEFVLSRPFIVWTNGNRTLWHDASPTVDRLSKGHLELPAGTHGFVKQDIGLLVWKYDYSIWTVIDHEIIMTSVALDTLVQHGPDFLHSDSYTSSSLLEPESDYDRLFSCLLRLHEFVRFASACIQANIHVSSCLHTVECVWPLLIQCLQYFAQDTHRFTFVKASRTVQDTCSPETKCRDRLRDLLFNQVLPSVLHLLSIALATVCDDPSSHHPFSYDRVTLWHQLLNEGGVVFPRLFRTGGSQNRSMPLALTPCHLTDQLSQYTVRKGSSEYAYASQTSRGFELLSAYLGFASGLLTYAKRFCMFDDPFDARSGLQRSRNHFEVLSGAILLVTQLLSSICPMDAQSGRRQSDDMLILTERCLTLLTDVLTSSVPEHQSSTNAPENTLNVITFCGDEPANQPASTMDAITRLQKLALHLLLNNSKAVESLLVCSSIPLRSLLTQYQSPGHGLSLPLSYPSATRPHSSKGRFGRIVWLALCLVHRLLSLECTQIVPQASSTSRSMPFINALKRRTNPSTQEHYLVTLFSYLHYPYNVWLGRAAVSILKWLIQYSDIDLMEYVELRSDAVRSVCLQRLASKLDDQLTRANLFDFIAETILCAEQSVTVTTNKSDPRPDGFLRLLMTNKSHRRNVLGDDFWWDSVLRVAQLQEESEKVDCLHCCILALEEVRELSEKGPLDQVFILLVRSVTKLVAALYLQDLHTYTSMLESRPDFWELLVCPLFTVLETAANKPSLSNVENEVCGHIISVIGLALFNSFTLQTDSKPSNDLWQIVKQLNDKDSCASWFGLVNKRIDFLRHSASHSELSTDEQQTMWQSHFSSLHDATCRWKCFLCVQLKYLAILTEDQSAADSVMHIPLRTNNLIEQLLTCLLSVAEDRKSRIRFSADALIDQLGTCLTLAVRHHCQQSSVPLSDINRYLVQLIHLLVLFRLDPCEQARHIHAELLACCCLLIRSADRPLVASDSATPRTDAVKTLRSEALDCAFGYLAQLSVCTDLTVADELAARQALCLMLCLWDDTLSSDVSARLVKTGVLHNLLSLLEQYSKAQLGAGLCHDIFAFLCRFALTPNIETNAKTTVGLYPDISKAGLFIDSGCGSRMETDTAPSSLLSGADIIASYEDVLSHALVWPSTETLLQWIHEYETSSGESHTDFTTFAPSGGDWIAFISVQLQFLCLMHDLLKNAHHPFVTRLLNTFCFENGIQLEALIKLWYEPLHSLNRDSGFHTSLPPLLTLLQSEVLSLPRIRLADRVLSVLWRALVSTQSLHNSPLACESGLPSLGFNMLFRSTINSGASVSYIASYGPTLSTAVVTSAFLEAESQVHLCSTLLRRSGFRTYIVRSHSTSSAAAVPAAAVATTTVSSQLTPTISARISDVPTPDPASTRSHVTKLRDSLHHTCIPSVAFTESDCRDEAQLVCFVRHLISCLSLLGTQLPSLGYLSLMTSEELHELRTPIEFIFNAPILEDKTRHLSFGTLISLAHSLQHLVSKVSGRLRSSSPFGSPKTSQHRGTLLSLLVQARELTLSIIFSQATLALASAQISPADKQLLVRELAGELGASCPFGRSSRRSQSFSRRSSTIHSSHSPESRSPSTQRQRINPRDSSPHTPALASMAAAATRSTNFFGNGIFIGDSSEAFGFEQAVERFADLLRLTL